MKRIVLLRHGESLWNKRKPFYWMDGRGFKREQLKKPARQAMHYGGWIFFLGSLHFLKRAVKTLNCVLDRLDEDWIPVEKTWRLNEEALRHASED